MTISARADHSKLVVDQFGPRARAYVESADHARGADLERLAALAAARPGGRILDLGCGGGHASFTVAPFASEVVAYDLSHEMLAVVRDEAARRGLVAIRTEQGNVEALPFADAGFDLVLTRFSAHHWHALAAALAEMRRVARPGGRVVVMDTVSPEAPALDAFLNRIELLRDPSHLRDHTACEWEGALRDAGFRPQPPVMARLRLAFDPWIARIGTPAAAARAIRALQAGAAPDIAAHFALEPDGTFTIDTMTMEAWA